jgi:putative molybdopterin biosynthesis protein
MSKIYLEKVSLNEAKDKYLKIFKNYSVETENIKVENSNGRVTGEAIYAKRFGPHYYASAMDGIAVKASNTYGASKTNPLKLKKGVDAIIVDTGDPIAEGFNSVIKIEEINNEDDFYIIEKSAVPWQNIRTIGESVMKGQLMFPVNHLIRPYDVGALLEAGVKEINVKKKPLIGIIPTGDEIISPNKEPKKGQLVDFNSTMMKIYGEEWGAEVSITDILPDKYEHLKKKVLDEIEKKDILIIIAGSSAGRDDYTEKILNELGEVVVHGVNIMPGKPVILGVINEKPVIGIPGYPISMLLNYYIFVRTLVYQMLSLNIPETPSIDAVVRRKIPSQVGLEEFLRVNLAFIDGEYVTIPRKKGSAAMESMINADGIMAIPEKSEGIGANEKVKIYTLKPKSSISKNIMFIGSHDYSLDLLINEIKAQKLEFNFNIQSVGSMGGLMSLKRGECHLAGAHLLDPQTGTYNKKYVKEILAEEKVTIINLVWRQQGLIVLKGNPMNLTKIEDLSRPDINFINRQKGSGTRVLLDYWLNKKGISSKLIKGYEREEFTHTAVAAAVANNSADVGLGIKAASDAMDLDFIPLLEERYDFIIPNDFLQDTRMVKILDIINSEKFKTQIIALGGYRTDDTGKVIY